MKKLAFVFLAGISFASAKAQLQFGVKAGANFATLSGSEITDAKTLINFNGGVFLKLPINHQWSIQPEVVYSGQGAKADGGSGSSTVTVSDHLNYLNIPILLKYSHGSGFYAETGPQAGILMSANEKVQGNSTDIKSFFNSSDFSWVFGVGYKVPACPVGIDLRYNAGISNIEDHANSGGTGSIRNGVFQLGLTYVLFKAGRK